MGKKVGQLAPRRSTWQWASLGALGLIAIGAITAWWFWRVPDVSGGTPRLVLDRTEVDLGFLPFEAPARVVFTLTNAGDGVLKLADIPRVKILNGC